MVAGPDLRVNYGRSGDGSGRCRAVAGRGKCRLTWLPFPDTPAHEVGRNPLRTRPSLDQGHNSGLLQVHMGVVNYDRTFGFCAEGLDLADAQGLRGELLASGSVDASVGRSGGHRDVQVASTALKKSRRACATLSGASKAA